MNNSSDSEVEEIKVADVKTKLEKKQKEYLNFLLLQINYFE